MKYDKEESEILKAYGSGRIKLSKPSPKEIEAIKAAAESADQDIESLRHLRAVQNYDC